jgi:hypothetical protein
MPTYILTYNSHSAACTVQAGAAAIFGPGTKLTTAAEELIGQIDKAISK